MQNEAAKRMAASFCIVPNDIQDISYPYTGNNPRNIQGRKRKVNNLALFECKNYNVHHGGVRMNYMTLREASEKWGITPRRINYLCSAGRIPGAVKMSTLWLIPKDAEKPIDGRTKQGKVKKDGKDSLCGR